MHFVTGGSFNGKATWVREYYELTNVPHRWYSGYKGEPLEQTTSWNGSHLIVLEGIEEWVKHLSEQSSIKEGLQEWNSLLDEWIKWEQMGENRKVILIGADITKGIVPASARERKWRDLTGWAYQSIAAQAERVDLIWYGISRHLKE
jgi:adenosylcobinamide kinase / adenosylcobinamide-phosphate guanylyltransferase